MDPPPDSSPSPRAPASDAEDHAPTQKLRLMCSYGGRILPRPHDKSLCYVGGETRLVVVDRSATTSASLTARLSSTLFGGRPFALKYQLPSEDLDSLISLTTDDDLENMFDEYDRLSGPTTGHSGSSSRLRLFLFPLKPESSVSLLEVGNKSDDWLLALNGTHRDGLNRGFSDSAASSVNCLLGLDDPVAAEGGGGGGKRQEVHSVPDSPMMETTSSFGSTSSTPSLGNFTPVKGHVEGGGGVEDQLAQIGLGGTGKNEDGGGFMVMSSPPPMPVSIIPVAAVGGGEYKERVFSDDERSDQGGGGGGYWKQQQQVVVGLTQAQAQTQPLPPQQFPSSEELVGPQGQVNLKSSGGGGGGVVDLPSPDSVSSESSIGNAANRMKPVIAQQESVMQNHSLGARVPVQQAYDSGYMLQSQFDQQLSQPQQQQQFIYPPGAHYIHHHHPGGGAPISAYYPAGLYPAQQQQQQQQHQQYPVYYVPARHPQAYNMAVPQSSISEAGTVMASTHPQMPPNASMVPPPSAYITMRNAPVTRPEMATAPTYRTATTGAPQLVQVPSSQHQQQYVAYSHQVHHPSQSVTPTSTTAGNYAYEFVDPSHGQVYYTQPMAHTMPSQYQTMTGAPAGMLPEASAQLSADNAKQQQTRTSQLI